MSGVKSDKYKQKNIQSRSREIKDERIKTEEYRAQRSIVVVHIRPNAIRIAFRG